MHNLNLLDDNELRHRLCNSIGNGDNDFSAWCKSCTVPQDNRAIDARAEKPQVRNGCPTGPGIQTRLDRVPSPNRIP